jgi:hypothetical protein
MPYVQSMVDKPKYNGIDAAAGKNPWGTEADLHKPQFMRFQNSHDHTNEFVNYWENEKRKSDTRALQNAWQAEEKRRRKEAIPEIYRKMIEAEGGENWTDDDVKIATKWTIFNPSWSEYSGMSYAEGQHKSVLKKIERAQRDLLIYREWQKAIRKSKEWEECEKEGTPLDVTKVTDLMSELFSMTGEQAEEIIKECNVTTLEGVHQVFYECFIPQAEAFEWLSEKHKRIYLESGWYVQMGCVFSLCTLGLSYIVGSNKALQYQDDNRELNKKDKEQIDKIFKKHFLRGNTDNII